MANKVCVCPKCNLVLLDGSAACPTCGSELIELQYTDIYWSKIDDEKKKAILSEVLTDHEKEIEEIHARENEGANLVMLTTGPTFEGYKIIEYKDVVYGEIVVPNGILGLLTAGTFFTVSALGKAREMALKGIKESAFQKQANAVVAVDIDISDLNGNGVLVSVNGTAVVIEKIEEEPV